MRRGHHRQSVLRILLGFLVALGLFCGGGPPGAASTSRPGEATLPARANRSSVQGADPLLAHAVVITPRLVGSAFQIAPGLAVTAAHVVDGLGPGARVTLRRGPAGGPMTTARLLGLSPVMDLAVLEIPQGFLGQINNDAWSPVGARPAVLTAPVAAGDRLAASGSVPLRDPQLALPRRVEGVATGRAVNVPGLGPGFVASLPGTIPGFSGGPVVDGAGRLAGMIVAIRRLPAAGRTDGSRSGVALSDEVYVLSAGALLDEAQRIAQRARMEVTPPQ